VPDTVVLPAPPFRHGRLDRDEQALGDLPVGEAVGRELGHPQLAGGQRPGPLGLVDPPPRPAARDAELVGGEVRERHALAGPRAVQPLAQRLAGLARPPVAAQSSAEVDDRVGERQLSAGAPQAEHCGLE
jgi:hypothetical protein